MIAKMCDFIAEPLVSEVQNWHLHTTVKRNRAWTGSVSKLHQKSLHKWQQPEHARRLEQILVYPGLMDLMEKLGYET